MRIDEAVEVDRALRFWQERALAYEQALREILTHNHRWTMDDYQSDPRDEAYMDDIEAVARAALDKPDQM